jgi:hypothetical protein
VARYRRVLGDDHPDTLTAAYNVAVDLRALGEYQQAVHSTRTPWRVTAGCWATTTPIPRPRLTTLPSTYARWVYTSKPANCKSGSGLSAADVLPTGIVLVTPFLTVISRARVREAGAAPMNPAGPSR